MNAETSNKYLKLRLAMQGKHSSISRWARQHHLPIGLVYNAARGERAGKRARQILKKLEAYAYAQ